MRRALAITTLLLALIAVIARARYMPATPLPHDAPSDVFSAARAREIQDALSTNATTRTTGSPGNEHGRATLSAALEKAGYRVERQRSFACTYHGFCAPIENVVGIRDGAEPGILLVAHHDSVPVSPGASDDGAGASTIVEAARALAAGPPLRHLLVVLLTDGEEDGLLGAEAFAHESPWAKRIRVTINVDSRGSSGPSEMFETSRDNAWLVDAMAQSLKHPATSSMFYEVYKRMPNDTDFTVLKTLGSGVNFANIARIEHYHTPLDNVENADRSTLQHHGENVVAMTRAFDALDLAHPRRGDANWFDVLSLGIVRWPEKVTFPLALIVLVLNLSTMLRLRGWGLGLVVGPAMLAAGIASSYFVGAVLKLAGALPAPWIAHPSVAGAALHFGTAAAAVAVAYAFRRTSPRAIWAGTWLVWALIATGAAAIAPGTAFLFLVPALVATLVTVISFGAGCIAGSVATAVLAFPLALALYDALGFIAGPLAALPTILLFTTVAPMIGHVSWRAPAALGGAALAFSIVAIAIPKFSADVPQRANVVFRQDESGPAKVFVDTAWGPTTWGDPPKAMVAALGDRSKLGREQPFAWSIEALFAPADRIEAPLPEANIRSTQVGGGRRKVTFVARSPRHAPLVALVLPATRSLQVKVEGTNAIPRWGYVLGLKAVPEEGFLVEIDAEGEDPIAVSLLDRTSGLPANTIASAAAAARPYDVTETQDGDVTVLVRALTF